MSTPRPDVRPFNQPTSRLGQLVFVVLRWVERRVIASSRVGSTAFFAEEYFSWLSSFKAAWPAILGEAQAVLPHLDRLPAFQDISREVGYITHPVSWLNRFVVFVARFSPLVRDARRNQKRWEREFYSHPEVSQEHQDPQS